MLVKSIKKAIVVIASTKCVAIYNMDCFPFTLLRVAMTWAFALETGETLLVRLFAERFQKIN